MFKNELLLRTIRDVVQGVQLGETEGKLKSELKMNCKRTTDELQIAGDMPLKWKR